MQLILALANGDEGMNTAIIRPSRSFIDQYNTDPEFAEKGSLASLEYHEAIELGEAAK
jgi:hypothetical protein